MFFVLSKLLVFLIYPFSWGLILLTWALFEKKISRRKILLFGSFAIFYIFSNQFIFDIAIHLWEPPIVSSTDIQHSYDVGIVLGGMSMYNKTTGTTHSQRSFDRLLKTIRLYNERKIKKIFISGGGITLLNDTFPEARYLADFLKQCGIPDSVIFFETNSRNTHENAVETKRFFVTHHWSQTNCLLISSAIHLPRARQCFEKEGFKHIAIFPTDTYSRDYNFKNPAYWLIPNSEILFNWQSLIKEWIGIIAYRLAGYT